MRMRFFFQLARINAAPAAWLLLASLLLVVAAAAPPCSGDQTFLAPPTSSSIRRNKELLGLTAGGVSPVLHKNGPLLSLLFLPRGGAAPPPKFIKKKAAALNINTNNRSKEIIQKKKSPFGLPALVGRTLYSHLDFIPFILYFAYYTPRLEGTAQQIYLGIGILHTLNSVATDYDGNGSLVQRLFGIPSLMAFPQWIHYWGDFGLSLLLLVLAAGGLVDGYNGHELELVLGNVALLLFYLFCE